MADVISSAKDRPITDALSAPGLIASTALGGLGGFIYDRYIKKNKDIKSNLLKGLLFGGGGALAYGAYTLASEALRQHGNVKRKASSPFFYEHEEPDGEMVTRSTVGGLSPSALFAKGLIRESRLGGMTEGGLIGYTTGSLLGHHYGAGGADNALREAFKESGLPQTAVAELSAAAKAAQTKYNTATPTSAQILEQLPKDKVFSLGLKRGSKGDRSSGVTVMHDLQLENSIGAPTVKTEPVALYNKKTKTWQLALDKNGNPLYKTTTIPGKIEKGGTVQVPINIIGRTPKHPKLRKIFGRFLPGKTNAVMGLGGAILGAYLGTPESQDAIRRGDLWGAFTNSAH